ncbi:NAD(P)-binding protein [Altererythrobacter aquiaggeris]|uniref:NAD(P)-binding protein n=1 Tax=Aestuarierythrobacter aquiaggeris TaxID=1898396 RepID=UPI003019BAA2
MANSDQPIKVAILGGGMGALATAFELSSQPQYEVTIHTLGWRLGGKCASSRGPNDRIEEHGIHGFLGSYYNACPMLGKVFAELAREPGTPIATFEEALVGLDALQMYSYPDGVPSVFAAHFPPDRKFPNPADPVAIISIEQLVARVLAFFDRAHAAAPPHHHTNWLRDHFEAAALAMERAALSEEQALGKALLPVLEKGYRKLRSLVFPLIESDDEAMEIFTIVDWAFALLTGVLSDDIPAKGFDFLDDELWSDWLLRHGAKQVTVDSPMALNTINLAYQYPGGDTSKSANMAAGAYVHWSLRGLAFCGHAIYAFAAGTGETVIAPFYEVLRNRGVKFEFFSKVTSLNLNGDGTQIASVDIDLQATLANGVTEYSPLMDPAPQNLPSWPPEPNYGQLAQGAQMKAAQVDLESWWTPWERVGTRTLVAGEDYDQLVFALSIGAVPYVCEQIVAKSGDWTDMINAIKPVQTQAFQMWLSKSMFDLGWSVPLEGENTSLADTYLKPFDGHCELRHIMKWEDWPADNTPKSLWYFCDEMPELETPVPPFSDHEYPARMKAKVAQSAIDYLNRAIGPLMPLAINKATHGEGAPEALDYSLLVDTREVPGVGEQRFASQFWRANIDPTERYVPTPAGSTKYRLAPWQTGFTNLTIAGDWTYTGLNVGSVECAVMSGRLASHAISQKPALDEIWGYPLNGRPSPHPLHPAQPSQAANQGAQPSSATPGAG